MNSLFLQIAANSHDTPEAYKWLGASYADWLMALGGAATFLTLLFLWFSGRGQQKSIDGISASLGELTKHSAELTKQSLEMTKQSQEMAVRNQLQNQLNGIMAEQAGLMREMYLTGKMNSEAQHRMLQLEEDKRRIELEPALAYTSAFGDANSNRLGINVTNFGKGTATLNSIVTQNGAQYFQLGAQPLPFQLEPGAGFTIAGIWNTVSYERLSFTLAIRYTDVLQNEYEVIIDNSPNGLSFKAPTLINRANNGSAVV